MTAPAAAPAPPLPPATLADAREALRDVAEPRSTVAMALSGSPELVQALRRDGYRALPSPLLGGERDDADAPLGAAVAAELRRLRGSGARYLMQPSAGAASEVRPVPAALLQAYCPLLAQTRSTTVYGLGELRVRAIRELAESLLPQDCSVAVVSSGVPALLDLGGRRTTHFPAGEAGEYAGLEVGDGETALERLGQEAAHGSDYLLAPAFTPSWLALTPGFLPAVRQRHREIAQRPQVAFIFSLRAEPA